MKKLIIVSILLWGCLFSITPVFAQNSISQIDIQTQIHKDGSATFKEVWHISVDEGTEIYKVFSNMHDQKLHLLSVKESQKNYTLLNKWDSDLSKEEKENKAGLIVRDDGYELCAGISDYGEKTYEMTYKIDHFVSQYQETQGINYAFLSDMSLDIDNVNVTVTSDITKFSEENTKVWAFGYEGQVIFQKGAIVLKSRGNIQKVQLLSNFQTNAYTSSSQYHEDEKFNDVLKDAKKGSQYKKKKSSFPYILFFIIIPLAIISFITYLFTVKHIKREKFSDGATLPLKDVSDFRDIPTKDLGYFYYLANKADLLSSHSEAGLLSAYLLKWIKEGYVHIEKDIKQGIFKKKESYKIHFDKEFSSQDIIENHFYHYFYDAAGDNHILETKEFESWAKDHYDDIQEINDFIDNHYEMMLKNSHDLTIDIEHVKKIRQYRYENYIYSLKVKDDIMHVIGLYKFLNDEDNMKEKEALEVYIWDEYLMFASIFNIADKVKKQLDIVYPDYSIQNEDFYYSYTITNAFLYHSILESETYHNFSDSGSGGFSSFSGGGGGFSGGGGGGVR